MNLKVKQRDKQGLVIVKLIEAGYISVKGVTDITLDKINDYIESYSKGYFNEIWNLDMREKQLKDKNLTTTCVEIFVKEKQSDSKGTYYFTDCDFYIMNDNGQTICSRKEFVYLKKRNKKLPQFKKGDIILTCSECDEETQKKYNDDIPNYKIESSQVIN